MSKAPKAPKEAKPRRTLSGRARRLKGHGFEREVADLFRTIYPEAKRGLGQARDGTEVADVEGTPFWVECKKGKASPNAALTQAEEALSNRKASGNPDPRPAVALTRSHRAPLVVSMRWETFKDLVQQAEHRVPSSPVDAAPTSSVHETTELPPHVYKYTDVPTFEELEAAMQSPPYHDEVETWRLVSVTSYGEGLTRDPSFLLFWEGIKK